MRELNRLGVTSALDAGGGEQNFPGDYSVIDELARKGQLTLRVAFDLMPQRPGQELADYVAFTAELTPGSRSCDGTRADDYQLRGAGEALLLEAVDFENFLEQRPELPPRAIAPLRWFVDHGETLSDAELIRIKALGGGVAVQGR